jgi:hypothetical protein
MALVFGQLNGRQGFENALAQWAQARQGTAARGTLGGLWDIGPPIAVLVAGTPERKEPTGRPRGGNEITGEGGTSHPRRRKGDESHEIDVSGAEVAAPRARPAPQKNYQIRF